MWSLYCDLSATLWKWSSELLILRTNIADKHSTITGTGIMHKQHFSLFICVYMAEKNPKKTKPQSHYLSDSDSLEDEVSQHLCTSQEERLYSTVKSSMQATQVALAHTTVQCNPMVE